MHKQLYPIVLQTMVGVLLLFAAARTVTAEDAVAAEPALYGRYTVIIDEAVLRLDARGRPQGRRASESLVLYISYDEDGWSTVMGLSPAFNLAHHIGRVGSWSLADGFLSLTVAMRIGGDPYVPGGPAHYELRLPYPDDHSAPVAGTFEGRFDGVAIAGTVHARRRPLPPQVPRGWLGAAEANRNNQTSVLFAGLTTDEMLARMEHPVVAAAHAAMVESDTILSHALLYHLSQFDGHAQRVRTLVEDRLAERGPGAQDRGLVWADRLRDVAYAHALMADTWDAEFRERVERYLHWITGRLLYRSHTLTRKMDWSPGSPQQAHFRAAAGISALAMLGQPGGEPLPSEDEGEQPRVIPALAERPAHSLLAVHQSLSLGETPSHWLVAGPIPDPLNSGEDMLAHMGGPDEFHLRVDDSSTVQSGSLSVDFEVLPESSLWENRGQLNIEFTEYFSRNYEHKSDGFYHTAYYASVINCNEPQRVRFQGRTGGAQIRVWLNGHTIRDGDYLDLEAGNYTLLVRAHAFSTNNWGKMWMSPAFFKVNDAEMRNDLRRRSEIRALMDAERDEDLAYHQKQQGADPRWWRLAEHAVVHMERYVDHAVGRGGWLLGGPVAIEGLNHLLEYRLLHGRRFARALGDGENIEAIVLRMVMQSVANPEGGLRSAMGSDHGSLAADHIARIWPILSTDVQPTVLWAWHRLLDWDPRQADSAPSIPATDGAIFTFLHYPVARTTDDSLPRLDGHWVAQDAGVAIVRNTFADADAIICQAHWGSSMAEQPRSGVPGDIQLYGYGHHWSRPANDPGRYPSQASASVVQIQRPHLAVREPGQVKTWTTRSAGGAILNLDLSPGYRALVLRRGREQDLRDVFHRPLEARLEDLGFRGHRGIAVDYSGKSGAPLLLVIADQIALPEDGPLALWQWNLPEGVQAEGESLLINEHGFRVVQGDGQLDAHLISRQPYTLNAHFNERLRLPGGKDRDTVHGLRAEGDFATPFIAVMTLGPRREAIPVTAQQRGQRWSITVGEQVIRVKGTEISFADDE